MIVAGCLLQSKYEASQEYARDRDSEVTRLQTELSDSRAQCDTQQRDLCFFETERRRLHNTIQELKGNIRVFCRVRPLLLQEEEMAHTMEHISLQEDQKTLEIARLADIGPSEVCLIFTT